MKAFKVCCISSIEEARVAVHYGASAIGLVSAMPSGPGIIDENLIREIAASLPAHIMSFLLTSKLDAGSILRQLEETRCNTVQLVDDLPDKELSTLRMQAPKIRIVQVIHVLDERSVQRATEVAPLVDSLLLDSGNPFAQTKELGGTGRTHDWSISRTIRDSVSLPVYLAGGLKPENVRAAVQSVDPYGVDICSGVRTNGRLDESKLSAFVTALTSA